MSLRCGPGWRKTAGVVAVSAAAIATGAAQSDRTGAPKANSIILLLNRIEYCDEPGTAFMLQGELDLPGISGVTSVTYTTGGGLVQTNDTSSGNWEVSFSFATFAEAKAAAQGQWTIAVNGASPSTSSFSVNVSTLLDANILATPVVVSPTNGAEICPDAICTWVPPSSGPLPAYVLNEWIDFQGVQGNYEGPSNFVLGDTTGTSWDPTGCILPYGGYVAPLSATLVVAYYNIAPALMVGPISVLSGSITWGTSPFAPPRYPNATPLFVLGAETKVCFTVLPCDPADLNCDGVVNATDLGTLLGNWASSGTGDLNSDGVVGAADLAILLGAWSG